MAHEPAALAEAHLRRLGLWSDPPTIRLGIAPEPSDLAPLGSVPSSPQVLRPGAPPPPTVLKRTEPETLVETERIGVGRRRLFERPILLRRPGGGYGPVVVRVETNIPGVRLAIYDARHPSPPPEGGTGTEEEALRHYAEDETGKAAREIIAVEPPAATFVLPGDAPWQLLPVNGPGTLAWWAVSFF